MTTKEQAKAAIYNRLSAAPTYHPATANLFEDFTVQSGDIVTVTSGNDSYNVPVFGMKLKWNGSTSVNVQSSGDEALEPLEKMAEKVSSRGGGYGRSVRQQEEDTIIRARLISESSRIGLVVEGYGSYAHVNPINIITAINTQTSTSFLGIDADQIVIGNLNDEDLNTWASEAKNGTGVFAKFLTVRQLTAQEITTMLANIQWADIGTISADSVVADAISTTGTVNANSVDSHHYYLDGDFEMNLIDAEVTNNGNTLVIYRSNGADITFNKGSTTTLVGAWGGAGVYTVTASPQGVSNSTQLRYLSPSASGVSVIGTSLLRRFDVMYGSDDEHLYPTGYWQTISMNANDFLQELTGQTEITANGTYAPSEGYIGFKTVTVNVAGTTPTTLSGSWSSPGVYTVTASPSGASNHTQLRYISPSGSVSVNGSSVTRLFNVQYGADDEHLYNTGYSQNITIDASDVYDNGAVWGLTHVAITGYDMEYQSGTNYGYKVKVRLKGEYNGSVLYENWYTSGWVLNAQNAYNNGWSGAYGEVVISPNSNRILDPGSSVTVKAQAKATSDSGLSDVASITVSAPTVTIGAIIYSAQSGDSADRSINPGQWVKAQGAYTNGSGQTVTTSSYKLIKANTDANLVAGNIKKDVSIFGITGTYDNYTGGHDVVPFVGSSTTTTYANRATTITSNGTYYAKAIGRSAPGAAYDTYVGGSRGFYIDVPGPSTMRPNSLKVISSSSGTPLGSLSGVSPGKYVSMKVGNTEYSFLCT